MKKLLIAIILAGLLSFSLVTAAKALLQDTEQVGGRVRGATINLLVGDNDPSTASFIFNNLATNEEHELVLPIASIGGLAGNFWMEVLTSNSQEGDNPESETDTTGEGELDKCAEVWIGFDNSEDPEFQTLLEAQALDWTPVNEVGEVEKFWGNSIDAWVGIEAAKMHLKMRADNCGPESMGDMFDMNLIFHLDQV
ncbi:MAG: hypothetical protein ABII10_02210 [Candidatus Paceibacterota bacterium]